MTRLPLITLRTAVMLPFTLILLLTVGVIAIAQHNSYERMLSEVSNKLLSSYTKNISNDLKLFLGDPFNINVTLADSIQRHQLYQPPQLTILEGYLFDAISFLYNGQQQINTIAFASEDGHLVGFRKEPNNQYALLLKDQRTANDLYIFAGNSYHHPSSHQIKNYNPLTRPWYAPFAKSQQAGWSAVYNNMDENQTLTISAVSPVMQHDTLIGITVTDINLSHIKQFLIDEASASTGMIYIMDEQGLLVGTSDNSPILGDGLDRLIPAASSSPLIAASGDYIQRQQLREQALTKGFAFYHQGNRYFSRITPYQDPYGLNWYIVVTTPEDDLLGQLPDQQMMGLIAALLLGGGGLCLGLVILGRITRPITEIADASKKLTEYHWDIPVSSGGSLKETQQLISAIKSMSRRLQHSFSSLRQHVLYDNLTGLLSQQGLVDTTNSLRNGSQGSLVLVGLKSFRNINDSLGHINGDQLLIQITERLQQVLPTEIIVSRVGRDEFALFSTELVTPQQIESLAQQALAIFHRPFIVDGIDVMLRARAGIVRGRLPENGINEWVRNASLALSQAKQQEHPLFCHYQSSLMTASIEQTRLTAELKRALDNDEFEVHYQPLINLTQQRICGAEALIRWRSPSRGLVPPNKFIPLAEDNGMIIDIGHRVLHQACQQTAEQIRQGRWPQDFMLHVNLSVCQLLQAGFIEQLEAVLETTQLPAANLTLEVTESRLVSQPLLTTHILNHVRQLGIHIAIDDFGTGYSSLAYLTQLPFDSLKIDRSFVNEMMENDNCCSVVAAIITIANNFHADIVAEGVETAAQAEKLTQLGCRYAQGFYYAKPLPLSQWSTDMVNNPQKSDLVMEYPR
ncbi:diguanylate cyclase [Photobacterium jeanii]|uniref:Diguanylate cyclase n=2 Tax=Vibrionaceae TaxID=641 RepID=A0A178KQH2_9GAMM|nr:EAL domain-containing protein [Photobacterium jeanii]OAN19195.1 diguanylate cyclase [Photobacterium jeanii]PST87203.1 diguanylate cyclase [Photobacterium jeanii]